MIHSRSGLSKQPAPDDDSENRGRYTKTVVEVRKPLGSVSQQGEAALVQSKPKDPRSVACAPMKYSTTSASYKTRKLEIASLCEDDAIFIAIAFG